MKVKQDVLDLRIETSENGLIVYEDSSRHDWTQGATAKRWVFSSFAELVYFLDDHFVPTSIDSLSDYVEKKQNPKQCVKDGRLFKTSCKDTNPWEVDSPVYGGGS